MPSFFARGQLLLAAGALALPGSVGGQAGGRRQSEVEASSRASETLRDSIKSNAVVIFSSSQCAKSEKTKAYFEDLGVPYYAIELDTRADGAELKKALSHATGSKSVPRVFVNGQV